MVNRTLGTEFILEFISMLIIFGLLFFNVPYNTGKDLEELSIGFLKNIKDFLSRSSKKEGLEEDVENIEENSKPLESKIEQKIDKLDTCIKGVWKYIFKMTSWLGVLLSLYVEKIVSLLQWQVEKRKAKKKIVFRSFMKVINLGLYTGLIYGLSLSKDYVIGIIHESLNWTTRGISITIPVIESSADFLFGLFKCIIIYSYDVFFSLGAILLAAGVDALFFMLVYGILKNKVIIRKEDGIEELDDASEIYTEKKKIAFIEKNAKRQTVNFFKSCVIMEHLRDKITVILCVIILFITSLAFCLNGNFHGKSVLFSLWDSIDLVSLFKSFFNAFILVWCFDKILTIFANKTSERCRIWIKRINEQFEEKAERIEKEQQKSIKNVEYVYEEKLKAASQQKHGNNKDMSARYYPLTDFMLDIDAKVEDAVEYLKLQTEDYKEYKRKEQEYTAKAKERINKILLEVNIHNYDTQIKKAGVIAKWVENNINSENHNREIDKNYYNWRDTLLHSNFVKEGFMDVFCLLCKAAEIDCNVVKDTVGNRIFFIKLENIWYWIDYSLCHMEGFKSAVIVSRDKNVSAFIKNSIEGYGEVMANSNILLKDIQGI